MTKPKTYRGITGFITPTQIQSLLHHFEIDTMTSSRGLNPLLMIGVLVSSRTLHGGADKFPERYPALSDLSGLFDDHPLALNIVHYRTDTPPNLFDELNELVGLIGPHLHGFQLNLTWPKAEVLRDFKALRGQNLKFILTVNRKALDAVKLSPELLVLKLRDYVGLADYVLLDTSGGWGQEFDVDLIEKMLKAIVAADLGLGLAVAGGLNHQNLDRLLPLMRIDPTLSFNAEGKLMSVDNRLDLGACRLYLDKAFELKVPPTPAV